MYPLVSHAFGGEIGECPRFFFVTDPLLMSLVALIYYMILIYVYLIW